MTIRRILVPVRGDGKGEGVLDHAVSLARRFKAHVDVLHCRPRPEDMLPFGVSVPAMLRKAVELVASGKVRLKPLLSRVMKLDDIMEAFDLVMHQPDRHIKIAIVP